MTTPHSDGMKRERKITRQDIRKKGIFIFPSLLTLGSIFLAFMAMVKLMHYFHEPGNYALLTSAGLLIVGAAVLDGFDGKVARLINATSNFGVQLDSLADAISFGVAPAIFVYAWALSTFGRPGWLVSFLFMACGVLRLARFNVQTGTIDPRFFVGLPIPFAAVTLISTALNFPNLPETQVGPSFIFMLTLALSYLMISGIRFRSFKEVDFRERQPVRVLVLMTLVLMLAAWKFEETIMVCSYSFVVYGLLRRYLPQHWNWQRVGLNTESLDAVLDDALGLDPAEEDIIEPPEVEQQPPPDARTH